MTNGAPTSSYRKMLLNELNGKHLAVQAYDERIWKIRTGSLTLMFGGWAALLGLAELDSIRETLTPMFVVTVSLAITAILVESLYVRRKYRCMIAINLMASKLFEAGDNMAADDIVPKSKWKDWLKFSGDNLKIKVGPASGYCRAVVETLVTYIIPTVGLGVASCLV